MKIWVILLLIVFLFFSGCTQSPEPPQETCGNKICDKDLGENIKNCPSDCELDDKPKCGNGVCDDKEDWKSCPADCDKPEKPPKPTCGDNICSSNETCSSCQADCGKCPIDPTEICGDDVCDTGESCSTCSEDCGTCPVASGESHLGTGGVVSLSNVFKNARIELFDPQGWKPNKGGTWIDTCEEFCNADCKQDKVYCDFSSQSELERYWEEKTLEVYNRFESPIATIHVGDYLDNGAAYPEGHEQEYIDFVEVLVSQYSDKIKYWTIQNEVENPRFWQGNMEGYSNLVELGSQTIKSKCPDCKVGIGLSFLYTPPGKRTDIMSLQGVCSHYDFIDAHVYPDNWSQIDEYDSIVIDWKDWLAEEGCSEKEFISLETGLWGQKSSGGIGGSEVKQAQDAVKISAILMNLGFSKISWNPCDAPDSEWGSKFDYIGMLEQDCSTKKEEYYSLKNMVEKVDVFSSSTKIADNQYKFKVDGNDVYVLWCETGSCSVPSEISGTVTVTDYLGNEETKDASGITLTDSPIFVE
ncbi:MAG: hypothetical protein ABIH20_05860 [Candidatus Diapherotrites archaeon]